MNANGVSSATLLAAAGQIISADEVSPTLVTSMPPGQKDAEKVLAPAKSSALPQDKDPEKAALTTQAIAEIQAALDMHQGALLNCPQFWQAKYRTALGKYKRFIKRQCHVFSVHGNKDTSFWVVKAGAPKPDCIAIADHQPSSWQKTLFKAVIFITAASG